MKRVTILVILLMSGFTWAQVSEWEHRYLTRLGFIPVSEDAQFKEGDFYVMQTEAREGEFGLPTAMLPMTAPPWVKISAEEAYEKCKSLDSLGLSGSFRLISRPEWEVIARNVASDARNWSLGLVGGGTMPLGNSDHFTSGVLSHYTAQSLSWQGRRKLVFPNHAEIIDLPGNAWEWADWDALDEGFTMIPPIALSSSGLYKPLDLLRPDGETWYQAQASEGIPSALLLGGDWATHFSAAGIYSSLNVHPESKSNDYGFRCVYRPREK